MVGLYGTRTPGALRLDPQPLRGVARAKKWFTKGAERIVHQAGFMFFG